MTEKEIKEKLDLIFNKFKKDLEKLLPFYECVEDDCDKCPYNLKECDLNLDVVKEVEDTHEAIQYALIHYYTIKS